MWQNNLLIALDDLLNEAFLQCEWAIRWDERQTYVEVTLQFELANPEGLSFVDPQGHHWSQDPIFFQTSLLFYDEQLMAMESHHDLVSIPVSRTEGILYGELIAIVKYLRVISKNVYLHWREFLEDPQHRKFVVAWSHHEYQQIKKGLIDSKRYGYQRVYYPLAKDQGR